MARKLSKIKRKSVIYGILASLSLFSLYLIIVSLFQGIEYTISRFVQFWYLMIPLVFGFGIQFGLFTYMRNFMRMSSGATTASGSASSVSIVACCAHHITDVVPILGVSALGIFLLEYQPIFLGFGIASNVAGIAFMSFMMRKYGVHIGIDWRRIKPMVIVATVVILFAIMLIGLQWYQEYYGGNYRTAINSELEDKCKTPSGYTDESWREHMNHHPDRYGECL